MKYYICSTIFRSEAGIRPAHITFTFFSIHSLILS